MNAISDDFRLIGKLQKGDVESFDLVYEKYSGQLYSFGLKYLKSEEEASELVQGVFMKVWENHKRLRAESSFRSYLFTIAYHDICKLFRMRKYRQLYIQDAVCKNPDFSYETEDRHHFQSVLEEVQRIINSLPARQKKIFEERRKEGKSTKEIAEEFGLSPGTVDNYISQTLKIINRKLHNENLPIVILICLYIF